MTEIKSLWGTKFEKELKSVWIGGSDERVDVDKTKIKFIDFYCVCEEIMSPYDCTLNVVAEGAKRIYEALAQINVCEDFGMARMMQSVSKYYEGLKTEYFFYIDSNSQKQKITAWDFIKQSYLKKIDPYHMKTNIVGTRNTYESPVYANKKAVGD